MSLLPDFKGLEAKMNRYAFHRALKKVSEDNVSLLHYQVDKHFVPKHCVMANSTYNSEGSLIKSLADAGIDNRVDEFASYIKKKLIKLRERNPDYDPSDIAGKSLAPVSWGNRIS